MRKKKKKISPDSFRKLSVGTLKGKARKLSRMIASREISIDEKAIYNTIMGIVESAVCYGHHQNTLERRRFKDKTALRQKRDFNKWITKIEDSINKNK